MGFSGIPDVDNYSEGVKYKTRTNMLICIFMNAYKHKLIFC
jgi:phage terminase large subunit-like protein